MSRPSKKSGTRGKVIWRGLRISVLSSLVLRELVLHGMQLTLFVCAAAADCPCVQVLFGSLALLLGGLASMVSHATIHACTHRGSFSGICVIDSVLLYWLCAFHFIDARYFSILHDFHHAYTNSPELDPQSVLPGQSWLRYLVSVYQRQIDFAQRPNFVRRYTSRYPDERHGSKAARYVRRHKTNLITLILAALFLLLGGLFLGGQGMALVLLWWPASALMGFVFLVDFAYRSHRGLPTRQECNPYIGQDTHDLLDNPIDRFLNWLTWGFYAHVGHHVDVRHTISR